MSFEAVLDDMAGGPNEETDKLLLIRRCFFYDFDGYPVRLWEGQGNLTTSTSVGGVLTLDDLTLPDDEWIGTIDARGNNPHQVPSFQDARDGSSPEYNITIPYISETVFEALKADVDLLKGRDLTIYDAVFQENEGLRPTTEIQFYHRVEMRGAKFSDRTELNGGQEVRNRSMSILCRSSEVGRSKIPNGIMNDASQNIRAGLLGLGSDSGCSMVASNARRTYEIGG